MLWINDGGCPPILAPSIDTGRGQMPFRPNYRFERAERDRVKKAKKEEKLRKRQEHAEEIPNAEAPDASKEPGPHESLRTA